ncbi:MAG: integrin alpha, partial [Candidatus Poseidoniaceae archaeon]|nr:integrin alpha [Candidatus Poseidoniaceae archaeon]
MSGLSMGVKKFHSYALVLLILFSIAAPLSDVIRLQSLSLEFEDNSQKQGTVGFSNGTGSQYLTGTQTINGIEWEVQPQTTLERHAWLQLHNSTADDLAVKEGLSVTLDDFGQVHACWRQHDSTNSTNYSLWSATLNDSGLVESTRVSDSGNPGISCDMAIDLRGNERMAWINADDNSVSIGRQVSPSQLDSHRTFHNRTVMNNQPADSLQIVIDEGAKETIIWRHANSHKLWVTGFTGSFWTTWKLLDSAVGQEFTATVDDSGTIGVVYLNIASDEIRLLEFSDSTDITVKVLEQGESAGSAIDVDQDQLGNEQVLYTLKDNGGTARLLRNLAGKDTGRIDTTALWTVPTISQGDQGLQVISDSDLNGDGYSDLIWSEPLSESGGNVTGMVAIHYGSSAGLNSTPDTILNGTFANERFGFGLAACDIDGDGFDELAIGRPGAGSTNTGAVVIYSGGLNGISVNPVWNYYGRGHDNETGWGLECAGDLNADNYQDLLISSRGANTTADGSGSVTAEHFGIVDLFYGSAAGLASTPDWTVNGTTIDSYLGTEMVGGGDFNGDGYDDIAISATGTLAAYMGYSEVILWAGGEFGLNSEPNRRLISNVQGCLFGYSMAWSDVNGDGLDDLAIGEPFNSSINYLSGKVWLYHGAVDANLTTLPAWTYAPSTNGVLAGIEITAADDVNEDGYEDLIITMGGTTSNGGAVELWLGSALGLGTAGQLIASGNQGEHSGWLVSSGGDANGDGMSEIAFSHRQVENVSTWDASISLLTEQDWESLDFQIGGNIIDTDLGVGPEGESIILITNQTDGITYSTMMRQDRDGSAVPIWVSTELIVDEGGRAWVMMLSEVPQGGHILEVYRPELSWVSMTNILAQTGDIGFYPALAVDSQDLMHIAFYDNSSSRLWYSVESSSGWTTES